MNKSIRSKLFISIISLLVFFIAAVSILNNFFLEPYYISKKKNTLIQNAKDIIDIYNGDPTDIQDQLDRAANVTGGNIDIRDQEGNNLYSSARRIPSENNFIDNSKPKGQPPMDFNATQTEVTQYQEGVYTFETRTDVQLKIDFLSLSTKLNNGDILSIRVPLVSISENVDIANKFILITGLIVLILGSAWAYLFSKRFTKPILELNEVANKMAKSDFSQKCKITGKDEVGQLSKSINYLSFELDKTITELNVKNKKLEKDIEREREIDEMRKMFISSVSHELRTPLSVIKGYAEGLTSNVAETEEDRNFYCEVIMSETDKMNKLVRDLLNLSQMESGYFHIEKKEFDLNSLIEYVLDKYQTTFAEKEIKIQYDGGQSIIVNGDMIRMEQILTNYINNALNHVDDKKIIKIDNVISDARVIVKVFNSGKHIPEDSLNKIWDSFYKVDKARTRAYGGYGLGLSIVKAIAEIHNSSYGVENVEDGVMFWFDVERK